MFDASKNLAVKCQPSYGVLSDIIHNKDLSWSKSENVYTRLHLNKLESIMRALSDALPAGHRTMANPWLVGWLVIEVEQLFNVLNNEELPSPWGHCREQIT